MKSKEFIDVFRRNFIDKDHRPVAFSFDMLGFECIYDYGKYMEESTLDMLADRKVPDPLNLNHLLLRARANTHRNAEVFLMNVENDISQEELWEWGQTDPQGLANIVREKGLQIFPDDRFNKMKIPEDRIKII